MTDEVDRTSAVGLYHFALSYRACAEQLRERPPKQLLFDAPIRFLFWHAVELFLKAYLRSENVSVKELRTLGHRHATLYRECIDRGLQLASPYPAAFFDFADDYEPIESRYIVTGYREQMTALDALSRLCQELHEAVRGGLQEKRLPIR